MKRFLKYIVISLILVSQNTICDASDKHDRMVLSKVWYYSSQIDTTENISLHEYAYHKFLIKTQKRNFTLLAVPSMYNVAHGSSRKFVRELYDEVDIKNLNTYETKRIIDFNTTPHRSKAMTNLQKYMTPKIYSTTIIEDYLLSPFHYNNRKLYKYKVYSLTNGTVKIIFTPKINNTQLIKGTAVVDYQTGRIIETDFTGEYDMIRFHQYIKMGSSGVLSLVPVYCRLDGKFTFLGNKLSTRHEVYFRQDKSIPDSLLEEKEAWELIEQVRPVPLNEEESEIVDKYIQKKIESKKDTVAPTKKSKSKDLAKHIFWDIIGDHLLNRIRTNFGPENKGYIRINPIFNPLYMSYSNRRGITYKFDVRASYDFSDNCELRARLKTGYSTKQRQFFFYIPIELNYNKKRNGYIKTEIDLGNRISNSEIQNDIVSNYDVQQEDIYSMFRGNSFKTVNHYDVSDKFSFDAGFIFHQRTAVHKKDFKKINYRYSYRTIGPALSVQYRPSGWKGPILTLDYEKGIKGMLKSDAGYEQWEFDCSYIHEMYRLQKLSLRVGAGYYTHRKEKEFFLDFMNFRENFIPGGWNDDWSGEFELLSSKWYNASRYYVRTNMTYESPLLLLSRIPFTGHFIEMERIYFSALSVRDLQPYIELGYSFTTRWLSIGTFVANRNGKFDGFGCKFGIEIFDKW